MRALRRERAARRGPAWPGPPGFPRLILAAVSAGVLLAVTQAPAGATTSPYAGSGYDASYPAAQCGATVYPGGFAVIGLGGGRPFTTNSCLAHEWALASRSGTPATPSLYFNTGYAGAYRKQVTQACKGAAGNAPVPPGTSAHQASTERQAWEIGCSEAAYAAARAPGTPALWWADIETGNSWSTNITYNDFTIDGLAYEMSGMSSASGPAVGVYSTPAMWNQIAGPGFVSTPAITADWQPAASCPAAGFTLQAASSYSPVWLIQDGTVTVDSVAYDSDQAC
jgi:hypothetical protein